MGVPHSKPKRELRNVDRKVKNIDSKHQKIMSHVDENELRQRIELCGKTLCSSQSQDELGVARTVASLGADDKNPGSQLVQTVSAEEMSKKDPRGEDAEGNINEAHNNYVTDVTSRRRPSKQSRDGYPANQGSAIVKLPRGVPTPVLPSGNSFASQFIKVFRMRITIDKRLTIIDERSPAVLKYRTPHFRALATVDIPPLHAGENFQIGWIQVCTDMHFINLYGQDGLTSWEFPEIVSGKYKMISDADGKQYPWYGSKDEVRTLRGPTEAPMQITVHMNDNFFPQVTWYIPHSDYVRQPKLTHIYRNQHFYAFLALRDLSTHKFRVLRAVAWSMELAIEVNPSQPLGRRAKLLGPFEQVQPRVVDDNAASRLLETYALNPPNANNAQVLVWRPRVGFPKVIVPPVQTTVDISQYLVATESYTKVLEQLANKVFGLR